jgi:hypothetical protein
MNAGILTAVVVTLARFPGAAPLQSPSGRFVVENEDRPPNTPARYLHALYVTEKRTRERRLLVEYARNVQVAWAPDRDALAVTNHVGSTQSTLTVYLFDRDGASRKLDAAETLYAAFPNLRGELVPFLHVHLALVQWHRGGAVECRLHAYAGTGKDIDRRYLVNVDGGQAQVLTSTRTRTRATGATLPARPAAADPRS